VKTLRGVLFERHQTAEAKLDAFREEVVAGLVRTGEPGMAETSEWAAPQVSKPALRGADVSADPLGWRQFWWSLRWHLAGLSAAWVAVLALNMSQAAAQGQPAPRKDGPSAGQVLAALRENQRQVRELVAAPVSEPAPARVITSPRSQAQPSSQTGA